MKTVVLGGPGAGKTRYLVRQVNRAVEKYGADKVTVSSLTKAAATEISSRGLNVNPQSCGTLHAICYRGLDRPPLVYDAFAEFNEMYSRSLTVINKKRSTDDLESDVAGGHDDESLEEIDLLRALGRHQDTWPVGLQHFYSQYTAFKDFSGTCDFTDLLERAYVELPKGPFGDVSVVLHDEAQDSSPLEYQLLSKWAETAEHTVLTGDDDQSLFEWRGASISGFLNFGDEKIIMGKSYRLPSVLLDYSKRWIEQLSYREPKSYEPRAEGGVITTSRATIYNVDPVLDCVIEDYDAGRSVMILTTCAYHLGAMVRRMKERGIPFHNPYRTKNGAWNPLRCSPGRASVVRTLLTQSSPPWSWGDLSKFFGYINASAMPRGLKSKLKRLGKNDDIIPFDTLRDILGDSVMERMLDNDQQWLLDSLLESKRKLFDYPVAVCKNLGTEKFRKHIDEIEGRTEHGIVVGTCHSTKGGQCDVTYIFPDLSKAGYKSYGDAALRDRVIRTFFVGLSRARQKVVLCTQANNCAVRWLSI